MMLLSQAHALLPGSARIGAADVAIDRVHSDTRTLRAGDLFVALKGERFDAHDYLAQAREAGAVAALASHGIAEAGLAGLQVADTKAALGTLAAAWRSRLHLPVIAVTGSNGKTTVTQMIASVLRAWVGKGAFSTEGNFNNDIGLPLTLLRMRQDDTTWHTAAVVELGMNHVGEIASLAAMAAPTVALVNNAQREHQEFMHSVEAVARENGTVIAALGSLGVAVYPADDEQAPVWHDIAADRPTLTFALEGEADVTCDASAVDGGWAISVRTPAGGFETTLRVAGLHNVKNALAATAAALAAGCPLDAIGRGLADFEPVKGRSQIRSATLFGQPVTLVDDTYNANPDSVRAAIDVLAAMPGLRWLVLGDMGEVGDKGPEFHAEVGAYARQRGIDVLWTVGQLATHASASFATSDHARHFEDVPMLLAALGNGPVCASIVVKGSRFMQMERVVQMLTSGVGHAA